MDPLVSVMVPTYNSLSTLPVALASMLAQTYQNWECIVVDDGSADDTEQFMQTALRADSRFCYIRFPENRGRPVARQTALDNASGEYLAMVDADDWAYPDKLERQVYTMQQHSTLALLSTGMAIVDNEHNLTGMRFTHDLPLTLYQSLRHPQPLPIPHPPALIRMEAAKASGYDRKLRRVQDTDFLIRILLEHPFGLLATPLYAYAEHYSLNWRAIATAKWFGIRVYGKYLSRFPVASIRNVSLTLAKFLATVAVGVARLEWLHGRTRPLNAPSAAQQAAHDEARRLVFEKCSQMFGEERVASNAISGHKSQDVE